MSHLIAEVNTNTPDADGEIALALSDVLGESSPADGDTPTYSTAWGASAFNPQTRILYYQKHFYLTGASGTNYSFSNNDYFVWRTTTSVQPDEYIHPTGVTLTAAQSATSPFNSNGTFKQSVTLSESGTYLFILRPSFGNAFASNDSINMRMSDGTSFGARFHVSTEGSFGDALFAIRTITTSSTFRFVISDIVGTCDVMEGVPRDFLSLNIYKIKE